jgi:CubicO group peptidase (beta-lactamase class C family)
LRIVSVVAAVLLLLAPAPTAAQAPGRKASEIQRSVARLLEEIGTAPGAAVGVIEGDRVVLAAGFGYRDVQRKLPVTPDTRFYIASTTKGFLAQAVLELAARGRIHLDSSLAAYVPALRFAPPLDARLISVRDLLSHRAGISSPLVSFLTSYSGEFTDSGLIAVLARSTPRPRTFSYANHNYVLVGLAVEGAAGIDWKTAIDSLVIQPLALHNTSFSLADRGDSNVARPYATEVDGTRLLDLKSDRTMHAGGGMASSLTDLLRWIGALNASATALAGSGPWSPRTIQQLLAPQAAVAARFGGFERWAYGLGWYLASYADHDIVQSLGGFPGFRSHVSFDPRSGIGVVALVNEGRSSAFLTENIAQTAYDVMFDVAERETRLTQRIASYRALVPRMIGETALPDLSRPQAFRDRGRAIGMTGVYRHLDLGTLTVSEREGGLLMRLGAAWSYVAEAGPDQYSVDLMRGALEGPRTVTVYRGAGGRVDSLRMDLGAEATFVRSR